MESHALLSMLESNKRPRRHRLKLKSITSKSPNSSNVSMSPSKAEYSSDYSSNRSFERFSNLKKPPKKSITSFESYGQIEGKFIYENPTLSRHIMIEFSPDFIAEDNTAVPIRISPILPIISTMKNNRKIKILKKPVFKV